MKYLIIHQPFKLTLGTSILVPNGSITKVGSSLFTFIFGDTFLDSYSLLIWSTLKAETDFVVVADVGIRHMALNIYSKQKHKNQNGSLTLQFGFPDNCKLSINYSSTGSLNLFSGRFGIFFQLNMILWNRRASQTGWGCEHLFSGWILMPQCTGLLSFTTGFKHHNIDHSIFFFATLRFGDLQILFLPVQMSSALWPPIFGTWTRSSDFEDRKEVWWLLFLWLHEMMFLTFPSRLY